MPDFLIEREVLAQGHSHIAGLDEAGRGALFGPVVAAAVVFKPFQISQEAPDWIAAIKDSKMLAPLKRKRLCRMIVAGAAAIGLGVVSSREIDEINIHQASLTAMRRALDRLPLVPDFLLVDGFRLNDVNYSQKNIIQGDKKSISIAAASIIAKVLRDEMIHKLDKVFEGYALDRNKGYGTKMHYSALRRLGPTALHRKTFNLRTAS